MDGSYRAMHLRLQGKQAKAAVVAMVAGDRQAHGEDAAEALALSAMSDADD